MRGATSPSGLHHAQHHSLPDNYTGHVAASHVIAVIYAGKDTLEGTTKWLLLRGILGRIASVTSPDGVRARSSAN
jgi:hypothetical protein